MNRARSGKGGAVLLCAVLVAIIAGCSTVPEPEAPPLSAVGKQAVELAELQGVRTPLFDDEREQLVAVRAPAIVPSPDPIMDEEITVARAANIESGSADGKEKPERPLPTMVIGDMSLSGDTDVAVVLRALAKAGGQNLLVSRGVEGTVSFTFQDVPWDEAFKGILAAAGLSYVWQGDIIRVVTISDMKRELEIEKVERERKTVQSELKKVEPLVLKVVKIRYTDALKLTAVVEKVLSADRGDGAGSEASRGSVTVDVDNNTIVIYAVAEDVAKMVSIITSLDRPKVQVLIEARIVEANTTTARDLGVQWGGTYAGIGNGRMATVGPGAGNGFVSSFPAALDDGIGGSATGRGQE